MCLLYVNGRFSKIQSQMFLYPRRTPAIGKLDPAVLMKGLSITNGSDLKLLLGLASKTYPSITTKVLPVDYHIPKFEYISPLQSVDHVVQTQL